MSVRHSYLALDDDQKIVADWLSKLKHEVTVSDNEERTLYYFRGMASSPLPESAQIDQSKTPLVFVYKPQARLGTLQTDAEVIFTSTPLKAQFPALHRVNSEFSKWLRQFDLVHSHKPGEATSEWNYYLEGSVRNIDAQIFALPCSLCTQVKRLLLFFAATRHQRAPTCLCLLPATP